MDSDKLDFEKYRERLEYLSFLFWKSIKGLFKIEGGVSGDNH